MDNDTDIIEPCRVCGIYFSEDFLRLGFDAASANDEFMKAVRAEMIYWQIQIQFGDRFPHFICNYCINVFAQYFRLRIESLKYDKQLRSNKVKPKIYNEKKTKAKVLYCVDITDDDDAAFLTPAVIPVMPIKEEHMEAVSMPFVKQEKNLEEQTQDLNMEAVKNFSTEAKKDFNTEIVNVKTEEGVIKQVHTYPYLSNDNVVPTKSNNSIMNESDIATMTPALNSDNQFLEYRRMNTPEIGTGYNKLNSDIEQCNYDYDNGEIVKFTYDDDDDDNEEDDDADNVQANDGNMKVMRNDNIGGLTPSAPLRHDINFGKKELLLNLDENIISDEEDEISNMFFNYKLTNEQCGICLDKFVNRKDLQMHIEAKHLMRTQDPSLSINNTIESNDKLDNDVSQNENKNANMPTISAMVILDDSSDEDTFAADDEKNVYEQSKKQKVDDELFQCDECPRVFFSSHELYKHTETHNASYDIPKIICHICGKKFDLKFALNRHLKKHIEAPS